jgi:hypothetical protein
MPLPFIAKSFKEIELALKQGIDGLALLTNYHGIYVGDQAFH